jgi:hypothetical protein
MTRAAHVFARGAVTGITLAAGDGLAIVSDACYGLTAYRLVELGSGELELMPVGCHGDVLQLAPRGVVALPPPQQPAQPGACAADACSLGREAAAAVAAAAVAAAAAAAPIKRDAQEGASSPEEVVPPDADEDAALVRARCLCLDVGGRSVLEIGWAPRRSVPVRVLSTASRMPLGAGAQPVAIQALGATAGAALCTGSLGDEMAPAALVAMADGSLLQLLRLSRAEGRLMGALARALLRHPLTSPLCIGASAAAASDSTAGSTKGVGHAGSSGTGTTRGIDGRILSVLLALPPGLALALLQGVALEDVAGGALGRALQAPCPTDVGSLLEAVRCRVAALVGPYSW